MQAKHLILLRSALAERRAQLLDEVAHAETDLAALNEIRETEFEEHAQDLRLALVLTRLDDRGKGELERIAAALARMDAGRYGACVGCGGAIPIRRLVALPATPYCRPCAERAERGAPLDLAAEPPPHVGALQPDYGLLTGRELEEVILEHVREDGRVDTEELRIVCRRGVVHLDGVIPSEREHQILLHTVTDVMGLSEVVDRLQVREIGWSGDAATSVEEGPGSASPDETGGDTQPPAQSGFDEEAETPAPVAGYAWNVLVTAQEGAARDLRRLLKRYGAFRGSGFRNVFIGTVQDIDRFLATLRQELEQKPFAQAWLGRVLPIRVSFPVRLEAFCTDVETHLRPLVDELVGKSFHVRVERRGHKGALHTHDLELRFAELLWKTLSERGANPLISFKDPDIIVAIEIAGPSAGVTLVSRAWRQNFPFIKID